MMSYPNVITLGTIKVLLVAVAFENRVGRRYFEMISTSYVKS